MSSDTNQQLKDIFADNQTFVNIFNKNCQNCNLNTKNDIIDQCQCLQRLAIGLCYYGTTKGSSDKKWNEFCLDIYGHNFLNDYQHLLKKHSNQLNEIKTELIRKYKLSNCTLNECKCTIRHLNRDEKDKENKTEK
eukprot:181844_1